ncbi:hypothetical protein BDA96_07G037700 [Sorghum bicolor]|jgi:NADH:ubiquinone reductase (non-electrogenic)|uniref:Pectinesterase inhibitor domain-containing protein n=2 Tax=Sorghum bicolor TaxID=4558 RepID=A0A921U9C4_SORBI|nr:uncharacterized protein LOC8076548 [Sorghum bicolor]EES14524.1 hypothetical protein SORBI_3007G035900 [Sorghum bicolor]KAG0522445.1 hypothetical protein BDA96_07G037700 [Sorghum bicolor]|eukprot:XP_002445029.1 uncharacterized protein LOC8076548 [Sorghum bicolor]
MKTTATILVLTVTAFLFVAGDACGNVPQMRWTDACVKTGETAELYHVCQETLQHGPDAAELTAYVILAARLAKGSYDDTVGRAAQLIADGSLPGEQRASYQQCIDSYATARVQMVRVMGELTQCDFTHAGQELQAAVAAMAACGKGLAAGTPLEALNAADKDRTTVVYDLGTLIFGRAPGSMNP